MACMMNWWLYQLTATADDDDDDDGDDDDDDDDGDDDDDDDDDDQETNSKKTKMSLLSLNTAEFSGSGYTWSALNDTYTSGSTRRT